MNPSKTLKSAVCAFVIATATIGSFSATAENTVTLKVPSVRTVVRSAYQAVKKAAPYLGALSYYSYAEPRVKDQVGDEGLQAGTKKLLECFVGIWFLDRVKKDAKIADDLVFGTLDSTLAPAA